MKNIGRGRVITTTAYLVIETMSKDRSTCWSGLAT